MGEVGDVPNVQKRNKHYIYVCFTQYKKYVLKIVGCNCIINRKCSRMKCRYSLVTKLDGTVRAELRNRRLQAKSEDDLDCKMR